MKEGVDVICVSRRHLSITVRGCMEDANLGLMIYDLWFYFFSCTVLYVVIE